MIALAAVLFAATVALQPAPSPAPSPDATVEYETGFSYEALSNGAPSWDSQYVRVTKETGQHHIVYGEVEAASRFNQRADAFTLGIYLPLGAQWQFNAEGSASDAHTVLPDAVSAGVTYNSGGGWFEGIAARSMHYGPADVNGATVSLERYWRDYRVYYALTAAHLAANGTDVEHAAQVDRYYGKNGMSYVGIGYLSGREIDDVGQPVLVVSHVDGWNIIGHHFAGDHWALVYAFGSFAQGSLYTRTGGHLGIEYRF